MYTAITRVYEDRDTSGIKEESDLGVDFSAFVGDSDMNVLKDPMPGTTVEETKRRGRPRKKKMADGNEIYSVDSSSESSYADSYSETNMMLKGTIGQIDMLNRDLTDQLNLIKGSKTLKKKYEYISELASTSSSLLSTKITAIRELNNATTNCHKLDLQRIKELKIGQEEQNDDKRIMDMYNAFINTPVGSYAPSLGPTAIEMTVAGGMDNIMRVDMANTGDPGFDNYLNNMTPEQRAMLNEGKNIKTCVVFDPDTGARHFDNIDMDTMQSVPGLPIPSQNILDECNINMNTGIARNSNLSLNYPLVVRSSGANLDGY